MRRHRLNGIEVGPVREAVTAYLQSLSHTRNDDYLLTAELLLHVFIRLEDCRPGKYQYPEKVTWDIIDGYVNNGTIMVPQLVEVTP